MKQNFKLVISVLMAIFLLTTNIFATEINNFTVSNEESLIRSKAVLEDSFSDNKILVTFKHSDSILNKEYSPGDFPEINVKSIEDLTRIEKNNPEEYWNMQNFHQILLLTLSVNSKQNVLDAIQKLEQRNDILSVEPDYQITISPEKESDQMYQTRSVDYDNYWGLNKINISTAWNITKGSKNVMVGILDSGIDPNHIDLTENYNSTSVLNKNFTTESGLNDQVGHGTHVAGTIGATGKNQAIGVCPNVTLINLKVFYKDSSGKGTGLHSWVIQAIQHAAQFNIPIINYSGGGFAENSTVTAYNAAISNYSGLFVCSAGNNGINIDNQPYYPASCGNDNLIAVGATNSLDILSGSNYGVTAVDLAAPGVNIFSTVPNNQYASWQGTSMAAPHVTAVAALIKSYKPDLNAVQIKQCILDSTDKVGSLSGTIKTGGRLNAGRALEQAQKTNAIVVKSRMISADVNGDGYDDYIKVWNNNGKRSLLVYLGASNGSLREGVNFHSAYNFEPDSSGEDKGIIGDVNGDGRADYIHVWNNNGNRSFLIYLGTSNGTFTEGKNSCSTHSYDADNTGNDKGYILDINGDGRSDYIHVWNNNGKRTFDTYLGQANGTFSEGLNFFSSHYIGEDPNGKDKGLIADVNGDGCDDYIHIWNNNGNRTFLVYLGSKAGRFSEGVNTFSAHYYGEDTTGYDKGYILDINGDGRSDYIHVWNNNGKRTFDTYLGQANGTFSEGLNFFSNHYIGEDPNGKDKGLIADVNGDGCDDYIHIWNNNGNRTFLVYLGSKAGHFSEGVNTFSTHYYGEDKAGYDTGFFADINGDGRKDYLHIWNNNGYRTFDTYLAQVSGSFNEGVNFFSGHYY